MATPNSEIFDIKTITLNNLLEKSNIKKGFDFLSIDVEGNESLYWRDLILIIGGQK